MKKFFRITLTAAAVSAALSGISFPAYAQDGGDIVILYTNDVHCGIDDNIGYDGLALYKREMQEQHDYVFLADAGDAIQGAPVGTMSNGAYITSLMNAVGYDAAIPGNHEFDYSVTELLVRADELNCGYICSNFYRLDTGELVFDPYKIVEAGDTKIAFVGAVTPETFISSTPVFFQNEDGEYIYGFGEDGSLYERIQTAVDGARAEGADIVIILGHLGEQDVREGWSAQEIAAQLTGIDAMIDAHSHDTTPELFVKDKDGKDVVITQTGTKLKNIGKMTISADGIKTELISEVPAPDENSAIPEDTWFEADDREGHFVDEEVNRAILHIKEELGEKLNTVIGSSSADLMATDPVSGDRIARMHETNLGDLVADSLRYVFGTDVAIMNGGGIRANIKAGDITYNDTLTVMPYGNMICTAEVSGQQILDLLEDGASICPEENGSFLQVSGIEYTIDTSIPSSVKHAETGEFIGVEGEYRVKNVLINGEPLDPNLLYTLATHNYYMKNGGDAYIISGKCDILMDDVLSDAEVFAKYIRDDLGGVISEQYSDPDGCGRIHIVNGAEAAPVPADTAEEPICELTAEPAPEEAVSTPASDVSAASNPATGAGSSALVIIMALSAASALSLSKRK